MKKKSHQKKIVMLVEDEELLRKIMKKHLEAFNYKVIIAESGEQALRMLDKQGADIILMDIQMPGIDGFETAKTIRQGKCFKKFKNYKDIAIIAFSAYSGNDVMEKAKQSGMNDYLSKASKMEIVREALNKWI